MISKIHLTKISSNEYFNAISHYFRVYLLSGLKADQFTPSSSFFFALAEVHFAVLNLPRQGFPATCRVGHCCVCSLLLLTSEIRSRFAKVHLYSQQRMNKLAFFGGKPVLISCVAWKPKMHDDVTASFRVCLLRQLRLQRGYKHTQLVILSRYAITRFTRDAELFPSRICDIFINDALDQIPQFSV